MEERASAPAQQLDSSLIVANKLELKGLAGHLLRRPAERALQSESTAKGLRSQRLSCWRLHSVHYQQPAEGFATEPVSTKTALANSGPKLLAKKQPQRELAPFLPHSRT